MTKAIHAILYEKLGLPDLAYQRFRAGYDPNLRAPFGVLSEAANSDTPYFATGAGGLLQAMLYGFGGLQITDQGLVQQASRLPRAWTSLTLTGIGARKSTYRVSQPP